MTTYVPVLKGKPGEFMALRNATPQVLRALRVMVEVVPTYGVDRDLDLFVRGVSVGWRPEAVLTYDVGYVQQNVSVANTADCAVAWTAKELQDRGVPARPVMRLDDGPDVLAEVADAVAIHGHGVCLRVGTDESPPSADEAESLIDETFGSSGMTSEDTHLVIDLQSVTSSREIALLIPPAREMLDWAYARGSWASVSVVSGAFPASTSSLPTNTNTAIHRFDADLFDAIVAQRTAITPDYGDFGINHPSMPTQIPRGPHPNLRYIHERDWQVFKQPRVLPGNQSFFTVCSEVVRSQFWPASGGSYSWGDAEVLRCSVSQGGAGRATEWRAYGTSRHLAHVVDRLATLGVP